MFSSIHSVCISYLCILLRSGGPGCIGPFLPEGSVRQHRPGLPSSAGGKEASYSSAGQAAEEAGSTCLPHQLHCKTLTLD